jgi:hypothetical protein
MKLLLLSGHEGSISWRAMISHIATKSIDVEYLQGLKDTSYRQGGLLPRLRNRVYVFLYYPLKVLFHFRKLISTDIIMIVASPFYLPLLVSILFNTKKIVIIHTDIYPEGFEGLPVLGSSKLIQSIYRKLSDKFYNKCLNLFGSVPQSTMRDYLRKGVVYTPSIPGSLNDITESEFRAIPHIRYIGTLGHHHHALEFIEMINGSSFKMPLQVSFNISGAFSEIFKKKAKDINLKNLESLTVNGSLEEEDYRKVMNSFAFGLVLMGKNASNVLFPSKFPAHLGSGHPIILVSDQKNELHDIVVENRIGLSINNNALNLDEINNFFLESNYEQMRARTVEVFNKNFHHKAVANKIFSEIKEKINY